MADKRWRTEAKNAQAMVLQLSVLGYSRTKSGKRKLRLFACGCSRLAWELLTDVRCRRAVETAERFADGRPIKRNWTARLVG